MHKQARNASQQGRAKSSFNVASPRWAIDVNSHTWTNPLMGARDSHAFRSTCCCSCGGAASCARAAARAVAPTDAANRPPSAVSK